MTLFLWVSHSLTLVISPKWRRWWWTVEEEEDKEEKAKISETKKERISAGHCTLHKCCCCCCCVHYYFLPSDYADWHRNESVFCNVMLWYPTVPTGTPNYYCVHRAGAGDICMSNCNKSPSKTLILLQNQACVEQTKLGKLCEKESVFLNRFAVFG